MCIYILDVKQMIKTNSTPLLAQDWINRVMHPTLFVPAFIHLRVQNGIQNTHTLIDSQGNT